MKRPPKLAGIWVMAVTQGGELVKWGLDGQVIMPYPPAKEREAGAQAAFVSGIECHKDDTIYIVYVFSNGQIKQFLFDPKSWASTCTLAEHAEVWWRTQGKRVPPVESAAYEKMYAAWIEFAFADFKPRRSKKP